MEREARNPGLVLLHAARGLRFRLRALRFGGLEPDVAREASEGGSLHPGYRKDLAISSTPRSSRQIRNQRRNAGGLMRLRATWPSHMPTSAGMSAIADPVRLPLLKAPPRARPMAS